jgi:hypothetical protein
LAYQPLASTTFLSQQTSHQQPASSTILSEQTSISHQPSATSRTNRLEIEADLSSDLCLLVSEEGQQIKVI